MSIDKIKVAIDNLKAEMIKYDMTCYDHLAALRVQERAAAEFRAAEQAVKIANTAYSAAIDAKASARNALQFAMDALDKELETKSDASLTKPLHEALPEVQF